MVDEIVKPCTFCREYVDWQIKLVDEKFKARDEADKLLREQNKIHFDALNHENARILAASAASVSRDT